MYAVISILVSTIICSQISVDRVFRCIRIYFVQRPKWATPKEGVLSVMDGAQWEISG